MVGPPETQRDEIVYPMPTWKERVFDNSYGSTAEIVVTVIVLFFILLSMAFIVFTVVKWNHPVIRAASPSFLIVVLVGSFFAYASVFTFMPSLVTSFSCNLKVWLFGIGFVLMFGALFAKSYRVHVLINNRNLKVIHIPDSHIWAIIFVLLTIELVLLAIFTGVSRIDAVLRKTDIFRRSTWKYSCEVSVRYWIVLGILIGVNLLLGIMGAYLAIQMRKIKFKVFNESKIIGFAMYNILFFGLLVAIIQSVNGVSVDARFITTDLLIIAGTAITIVTLFGQKLFLISSTKGNSFTGSSSKEPPHSTSTTAASLADDEKQLRNRIETLEDQVELLRESLISWKKDHEDLSKKYEDQKTRYEKLKQKYLKGRRGKITTADNSGSVENSHEMINLVGENEVSDTDTSSL
eukprot:TRINITY_DN5213_c0_g1_i2.p1 TRINITY_DN5213_c0_g1~~TRINITY_DN5213_c0_g1_i2.p1  ORF type:complete len:406 (+),score=48.55 TRINITY_DN5213_c0_g1_i2:863-2080(+)